MVIHNLLGCPIHLFKGMKVQEKVFIKPIPYTKASAGGDSNPWHVSINKMCQSDIECMDTCCYYST